MVEESGFAKVICSICYEDLKPIVEDLQAIPVCGHVFHELCLQQWFEYCSSSSKKKYNCPVCKQTCSQNSVGRLYFQSVGSCPNDPIPTQKPADPEALHREVKILELKVTGLNSSLEHHQKNLKELNEELCICKEQAKKEATLKSEALSQKTFLQQKLSTKSEELNISTSECLRLQERNMALAKELAAFKLISDLNLEEEEVLKFASLGHQVNSKDTVDILKKSLVIRNKQLILCFLDIHAKKSYYIPPLELVSCLTTTRSYKELIEKYNHLGKGEARLRKKLEKATERGDKLKARVYELETITEVKDNEVLRALKNSKKSNGKLDFLNGHCNPNVPSLNNSLSEDCMDQCGAPMLSTARTETKRDSHNDVCLQKNKEDTGLHDRKAVSYFLIDDDEDNDQEISKVVHQDLISQPDENVEVQKSIRPETVSNKKESPLFVPSSSVQLGTSCLNIGSKISIDPESNITVFSDHFDDAVQVQPSPQIRRENSCQVPIAQTGNQCFSGGLVGPDGTNRFLGKWCKRSQESTVTGNLISVGADGRGGRIKFLRTINQSSDGKETAPLAKKCKIGAKTSSSKGCLQIDQFFGKAGHQL